MLLRALFYFYLHLPSQRLLPIVFQAHLLQNAPIGKLYSILYLKSPSINYTLPNPLLSYHLYYRWRSEPVFFIAPQASIVLYRIIVAKQQYRGSHYHLYR